MISPLLLKLAAGAAVGYVLVSSKRTAQSGASGVLSAQAGRLRNSRATGGPTFAPNSTKQLIQGWQAGAGVPSALDWVHDCITAQKRSVYYDITLASTDRFYLLSAPTEETPSDPRWNLLASPSDASTVQALRSQPVPFDAGAPLSPNGAPAASEGPVPSGPEQTGIPEVDALLRADDATPHQLRTIAAELEKGGNRSAADVVRRRADALYTSLRVAHAAEGGTPWKIRDGDNPDYLASHYGGTAQEVLRLNNLRFPEDWQIDRVWRLPLDWKVEGKAVPPLLRGSGKGARAGNAAPKEGKRAEGGKFKIPVYEAPAQPPEGGVLVAQKAGDAVRETANIKVTQPARAGVADAARRAAERVNRK